MKILNISHGPSTRNGGWVTRRIIDVQIRINALRVTLQDRLFLCNAQSGERGDVPGWVLVVLMTTGLVTAIWTIAAPRLTAILRNSLDSMNGIR